MTDTTSLADWTNPDNGSAVVTLPSGTKVRMRYTDLATHLRYGAVPAQLRAAVMDASRRRHDDARTTEERDDAAAEQDAAWLELLADVIVKPKVTAADLRPPRIPAADLAMLLALAQRENVFDAAGVAFGVVAVDPFESFRDVERGDADRDAADRPASADPPGDE